MSNDPHSHDSVEVIAHMERVLERIITRLERALDEVVPKLATKTDLAHVEHHIMSAISDFASKVTAFFDRQDTAITALQGDVKNLEDQITALQNSPGQITPEDQALLDGIQARASAVADKLDALDALTPPVAPPTA